LKFDLLIINGHVLKGGPNDFEPVIADIAVSGDRISGIGDFSGSDADMVIDISGLFASPGFIDTHSHSEFTLLADGRAEGKISQGITTEVNGNCGLSAAPMYGPALDQREDELRALDIRERWNTFDEYFEVLNRRGFALNFSSLVGHNSLRASVMGYSDRNPTESEVAKMVELLRAAINSGARGLSTGLIYPPGIFSDSHEIIKLASAAASQKGIYATHMRDEGDKLLEAVDEVLNIASLSGIHAHVSHLKTNGNANWHKIGQVLEKIEMAIKKGLSITCDRYPYIASSTDLDAVLPSWAFKGGRKEELRIIKEEKSGLIQDMLKAYPDESHWQEIMISSVRSGRNKWMEGSYLSEVADIKGKTPLDAMFDILLEEDLNVGAIFFSMNEDNLKSILGLSYCMVGTDSSARSFDGITATGKPHPRGFGSFPKILGKYVRDDRILGLGEAVYKMSGLPAEIFRLNGRGTIKEGYFADIVVFDPGKVNDTASYDNPFSRPEGIYHVIINGVPVMLEGKFTGALPGRILR